MREKDFWDIPRIPKGLDKTAPLETNSPKRTWRLKKERHKIKEYLNILKIPFKK